MRERQIGNVASVPTCRITPARAGKTYRRVVNHRQKRDHPRSCGKDLHTEYLFYCFSGSPPLVRERQVIFYPFYDIHGITPARAGKTMSNTPFRKKAKDHPRSCGKDSNGSLNFSQFFLACIQNLFNFFARHLMSSASPSAR